VTTPSEISAEGDKKQAGNSPETIHGPTVYAYNMDETKTPGGLKVRWKIRVASGAEAARADARQAEAIRELLQWAQHHTGKATR